MTDRRDRYRGALLGLAIGDALGTTLEFRAPGTFEPIDRMLGGGTFGLAPGQWTDDTSMALCLAESLVEQRGFDPLDQMRRYLRWYREGYLSSTGRCFDIGNTTRAALERFERTGEPFSGDEAASTAGNGSIMRLAPIPLFFSGDASTAIARAADSSRTTHAAREAIDACRYMAAIIVRILDGAEWSEPEDLSPRVAEIASGSFRTKQPPEIRGTGYVVQSLEAALWAVHHTNDFRSAVLNAVNLGDDADTTGAVCGQIAGAMYGASAIPEKWLEVLHARERIIALADALYDLSPRSA